LETAYCSQNINFPGDRKYISLKVFFLAKEFKPATFDCKSIEFMKGISEFKIHLIL
jgi:hypothetical protein